MKERPILFSGEMVRAILDGRKSQTRRVMKPQPTKDVGESPYYFYHRGNRVYSLPGQFRHFRSPSFTQEDDDALLGIWGTCPYGRIGDRLWVRETWMMPGNKIYYRADMKTGETASGWTPSIYMPRWASRITLDIINVRVERLRDMEANRDDAFREGINPIDPYQINPDLAGVPLPAAFPDFQDKKNCFFGDPVMSYRSLWNSINAKRGYGWDVNPWCWVIEFGTVTA